MNFSLHLITFILRVYFRLTLRLDALGMEKVPAQGPLIIISNHTGQIEVPVLATLLQPRKITGWAKAEAFENPFLRWVFGAWGIIPVHRGEADIKSLKLALRSIEKGLIFGIAPRCDSSPANAENCSDNICPSRNGFERPEWARNGYMSALHRQS